MNDLKLLQMVYTRISHDLAGASGAVYNGLELLEEDLECSADSCQLIKDSASTLMARLKFFRQTFGLPSALKEDTTLDYLKTFSMPFTLNGKCSHTWQQAACMIMTDLFYKGAQITVEPKRVSAKGVAHKDWTDTICILQTGQGDENANNAPAFYLNVLMPDVVVTMGADTLTIERA